jgi:hypothetical protein
MSMFPLNGNHPVRGLRSVTLSETSSLPLRFSGPHPANGVIEIPPFVGNLYSITSLRRSFTENLVDQPFTPNLFIYPLYSSMPSEIPEGLLALVFNAPANVACAHTDRIGTLQLFNYRDLLRIQGIHPSPRYTRPWFRHANLILRFLRTPTCYGAVDYSLPQSL